MKQLLKQLAKLNEVIDRKILAGESYKKEAIQHKNLLAFINDNA